jgi:hypothetical protein
LGASARADQALVASQSSPTVSTEGFDPSRWQPMETAPRDGTRFLGCEPGYGVFIVSWQKHRGPVDEVDGRGWLAGEGPTHWMPLPEPPVGK